MSCHDSLVVSCLAKSEVSSVVAQVQEDILRQVAAVLDVLGLLSFRHSTVCIGPSALQENLPCWASVGLGEAPGVLLLHVQLRGSEVQKH